VGVRRYEPQFLAAVEEYLGQVLDIVRPLQVDQGGPVLLVQVENEYGAFGNDQDYLEAVAAMIRKAGITVPLVTVDQPVPEMLAAGGLDGVLRTGSFGSRSAERLRTLREHQPTGPLMCMEFWDGWFDHWGGPHHTTGVEEAARELDALLAEGASVNIYMFHGGTNFGLTSGADDKGVFRPTVTSYDYDAPLDEAGRPTAKYHAFREVLSRYATVPMETSPPVLSSPAPQLTVPLREPVRLLADPGAWGIATSHATMPSLDDLHARLALFRTEITVDGPALLTVGEVRDRVLVFLDGSPVGVLERERRDRALMLPHGKGRLDLVVEDQGRVNYGPRIGEPKGLLGGIELDAEPLTDWAAWAVALDAVPKVWTAATPGPAVGVGPTAWRATFSADRPVDHFLRTDAWGKGLAWVNGFCLGRYWHRGPQQTLYVPGPLIRPGDNELVVLELETMADPTAAFVAGPSLGPVEN
jgi:beta-galactosidase